jgi:hypothetical protein
VDKRATKLTGVIKRGDRRTKEELITELEKIGVKLRRSPYYRRDELMWLHYVDLCKQGVTSIPCGKKFASIVFFSGWDRSK